MSQQQIYRGRGACTNPDPRFEQWQREVVDDGWGSLDQPQQTLHTTILPDSAKTVISYNQSPDVSFDRSINPYRGCEHGCVYCFARPTHAYLGLSPGLDFESKLFYKADAASLLRQELAKKSYQCQPIALGINTDAYQPIERQLGITRAILQVLHECAHPVTIVTKSALIERDIDILADMAQRQLVQVAISITTLKHELSRQLEPRATAPLRRLQTVTRLSQANIPVSVFIAPLIPVLTDAELESIMAAAKEAGASCCEYILLRLPHELGDMFEQWLRLHEPLKAEHVLNCMRDCRGGKIYQSDFGARMTGKGSYADLIRQRFHLAYKRLGFTGVPALQSQHFVKPNKCASLVGQQLSLF